MAHVMSNPPPEQHVAACGLFCTNCGMFKKGRCKGCQIKPAFSRCAVRRCCVEKGITVCAQCGEFAAPRDFRECKKLNNLIAKVLALVFGSKRLQALAVLRDDGVEAFVAAKRASGKM